MLYKKNAALILSGGTGVRFGADIPKQYIEVGGKPVISYCVQRLFLCGAIDAVQIVADGIWHHKIMECIRLLPENSRRKFRGFSVPGKTRQLSILNGLEDMRGYAGFSDYVLIHDAARPLLSDKQIIECFDTAAGHDGAVPVLPVKDTVYASTDGSRISSLLKRDEIFAGQAPEAFLFGKYYEANRQLLPDEILNTTGSAEPAVMAGMDIALLHGDENNFKITTKADLKRFQRIVEESDGL